MSDTETATRRPWFFNFALGEGAMVIAALAPETVAGHLSQLVVICLAAFVLFQAGALYQLDTPRTVPTLLRGFHIAMAVLLIVLCLTATESATRFLLGSFTAMAFFTLGDIWCYWQKRRTP